MVALMCSWLKQFSILQMLRLDATVEITQRVSKMSEFSTSFCFDIPFYRQLYLLLTSFLKKNIKKFLSS